MTNKHKFEPMQDAPIFEPTDTEFADPLTYIEKIRPIAEKYGICKIIPPKYWKPNFCIDMDSFKFTPRIQRLNELEAGARIKMNFLEKLSKFWELQGQKLCIPLVERKQLDLYRLHILANSRIDSLNDMQTWNDIVKEMNFRESTAKQIKSIYEKLIYPYVLIKTGATLTKSTGSTPLKRSISNLDSDNDSRQQQIYKKKKKSCRKYENINCLLCSRGDDDAFILLCDECDDSYHTYCLIPALTEIPPGDWRCPNCVAEICKKPTDSYGFEQSKKKYSLNEFGQMANKFKENYFKKKKDIVTPEEIEQEFWRILASPNETVVVEYGADLHTLEIGSGFPTFSNKSKSKSFNQDYLNSPWNLNNLPKLEKSILSQINIDISGMKVPWAYVGMLFSCFCWHVEDHWSYSINYLHWGEIKTWYGVSGNDADKFEQIMKQNANELFESSPDLLHHLVTIMDPRKLNNDGLSIFKLNQKKGEFVITFPRAYHAGFNQGFNFAEAVNFCPADWIPIGRAAIENYKLVKRHTVFSHDELVFRTACSKTINDVSIIEAIRNELTHLIRLEQENQTNLKDVVSNWKQLTFEILTDDERTCDYCNTTCFLSAVKCSCSPTKLACPNHYEFICNNNNSIKKSKNIKHKLSFIYRYSIDEMKKILNELNDYTHDYSKWCSKAETLLAKHEPNEYKLYDSDKKPHLNDLVNLIEIAKQENYDKFSLGSSLVTELKDTVKCAQDLIDSCRQIIQKYKKVNKTQEDEIIFIEEVKHNSPRKTLSVNDFKYLIQNFDSLKCHLDEKDLILLIYKEINEQEAKIDQLITDWNIESSSQIRKILTYLSDLNIEFDEIKLKKLKLMFKQASWMEQVNEALRNPNGLTLEKINNLIDKCLYDDLMSEPIKLEYIQKTYNQLIELLSQAQSWDTKAHNLLKSPNALNLKELETTYSEASQIPAKLFYVEQLKNVIREANNLNQRIKQNLEKKKPNLNILIDLLNETKKFSVVFNDLDVLKIRVEYTNEWLVKLTNLFIPNSKIKPCLDKHIDSTQLMLILNPRLNFRNLNEDTTSQISKSSFKSKSKLNDDINEQSLCDLYSHNITNIKEKIKTYELKEIEQIKELRLKNIEKVKPLVDESNKKPILKCCTCSKSITSTTSFEYCKLCFGLYHNSCKNADNSSNYNKTNMCSNCKRSKRPHIDQVYEMILAYEKLEMTCAENKSLQIFFNRFTKWQERFDKFFDSESLTQIKLQMSKKSELNNLKRIYSDVSSIKRVELNELNIECLLMETHNEYTVFLNEFCDLIELNNHCYLVDFQVVLDSLSKFKSKKSDEQNVNLEQNGIKKSKRINNKKLKDSNERRKNKKIPKKAKKTNTCLIIENKSNNSQEVIDLNEESMDSNKTEYDSDAQLNNDLNDKREVKNDDAESDAESVASSNADSNTSASNVFCLCKRGSFGQMICCDNNKCKIEWFHFECVRLKSKPKGKWYCPNCKNNN